MLISVITSLLDNIRTDQNKWEEIRFLPNLDSNVIDEQEDLNYINRTRIIYALYYDFNLADYSLIKFCFEQEILFARKSASSFESSRLVAFLLSKFRIPENCLLFAEMKYANFDNICGFDRQFFFSAGINDTLNFLEKINYTGTDANYLTDLLSFQFSENDIIKWHESKEIYFSSLKTLNQEDENLLARDLQLN